MFDFKTIMNNIKNLEWKKYFYKNLTLCSLVIFFVFSVITVTLTIGYREAVNNELNRYCIEVSFNIKDKINKILETLTESYNELITNCDAELSIAAEFNDVTTKNGSYAILEHIKDAIAPYKQGVSYVDSIYIYFPKSEYVISNSSYFSGNFRDKFTDAQWIDKNSKSIEKINARIAKRRGVSKSYFTIIKPINTGGNSNLIAYNIDIEDFFSSASKDLRELYIVDENKKIIYGTDRKTVGLSVENMGEKGEKIKEALKSVSVGINGGENIILTSANIGDGTHKIVMGIDSTDYNLQLKKIRNMLIFVILFVALLTLILAFFIVSEFYNNILDLVMVIDGKERKNKRSFREITFIKNKILNMIDKNSKISDELANRVELVSKIKMEALQSQLNSHFLYNTLGLISAIDILENKRDTNTVKAIAHLSEILRFAMNKESYTVPLSEELIFVRKYLEIQKLRYKDRFDYIEEIDENLIDTDVIKMLIQPLLENAIFHGIVPCGRKCILSLKVYSVEDVLKIQVTDDGTGITSENLQELRQEFTKGIVSDVQTHGLMSVNQKCMLFYGSDYGCEVECDNGRTTVTVKLPILQNENMEDDNIED